MRTKLSFCLWLASALPSLAQTSPAQMGITPSTTPEVLKTLDRTNTWVPLGNVDPATHTFTPVGGGGGSITAGTTTTTGFNAGQLMMSDGTKVQGSGFYSSSAGSAIAAVVNFENGFPATTPPGFKVGLTGFLGWTNAGGATNNADTALWRDASGVIGQRAQTAAQASRVYNTYTDASNGEWGALDWQTTPNVLTIGTQANGTGTARNLKFVSGATNVLDYGITVGGVLTAPANFSVGSTGASTVYFTTNETLNANSVLGFASGCATCVGIDTAFSRISAGVMGVGTGAQGSMAGIIAAAAHTSGGTQPTITGAGGTCATSTKVGGASAGTVVLSGVCATGNTIAWTGMPAATNGYACDAEDRTTRTALFVQSASTTTGFTLTTGAVSSVAGDVLQWKCMGY